VIARAKYDAGEVILQGTQNSCHGAVECFCSVLGGRGVSPRPNMTAHTLTHTCTHTCTYTHMYTHTHSHTHKTGMLFAKAIRCDKALIIDPHEGCMTIVTGVITLLSLCHPSLSYCGRVSTAYIITSEYMFITPFPSSPLTFPHSILSHFFLFVIYLFSLLSLSVFNPYQNFTWPPTTHQAARRNVVQV